MGRGVGVEGSHRALQGPQLRAQAGPLWPPRAAPEARKRVEWQGGRFLLRALKGLQALRLERAPA